MMKPSGEIIIGSVIVEADPDPGICLSNLGEIDLFPRSCPSIMSRRYLLDVISQCGLTVSEKCSEYDEIVDEPKLKLLEPIAKAFHRPPEGLLRRVVWKLRFAADWKEPPEVRWWLRSEVPLLRDCDPADLNIASCRTIATLTRANRQLQTDIQQLEQALMDRETDLERERRDAALRSAELADRTVRLEEALATLDTLTPSGLVP
jgi:hypothetical protein